MDIKVALVYGDPDIWLDRQIMRLKPESEFSHGAFIVYPEGGPPTWWDIHFRWFLSDLRSFPAGNYAWDFSLWKIKDLIPEKVVQIVDYILATSRYKVHYDFPQVLWQYLAEKLGWDDRDNPFHSPGLLQSAEFLTGGLERAGYDVEHPLGMHLYSYLTESGHLELEQERIRPGEFLQLGEGQDG